MVVCDGIEEILSLLPLLPFRLLFSFQISYYHNTQRMTFSGFRRFIKADVGKAETINVSKPSINSAIDLELSLSTPHDLNNGTEKHSLAKEQLRIMLAV